MISVSILQYTTRTRTDDGFKIDTTIVVILEPARLVCFVHGNGGRRVTIFFKQRPRPTWESWDLSWESLYPLKPLSSSF